MTVCADVEALIPMQTPFCQFCPGGQCSFPPSSSHSFAPFPPTMFLLFLPQFYSHFVKQIPTNSAWTSSSLLYSHSSLSLSLLFQILIPANQTKPFRTLLHPCTLQSYFQTKPITQNSPVPWIWEEVQRKTLWPSQTRPIRTKPNQSRPIWTKLNPTFCNSPAPLLLATNLTCTPAFGSQCTWREKASCLQQSPSKTRDFDKDLLKLY